MASFSRNDQSASLTIRDTTQADISAIVDLYNYEILHNCATFHTEPQTVAERTEWLTSLNAENYPCLVAEVADGASLSGKRVVGFCSLGHYNQRKAYDRCVRQNELEGIHRLTVVSIVPPKSPCMCTRTIEDNRQGIGS